MSLPAWARDWIFGAEGGLSNDSADPGGLTKYGISQRAYPQLDIANLTQDDAARIYDRDYFQAVRSGEMPPPIALAVFDSAVNQSVKTAGRLLQESLGVRDDGEIGPQTIQALRARLNANGHAELLADFLSRRALHYATLCKPRFERGWFRRLFLLQAVCLELF
jgi:lysozyme family protein